MCSQAKRMSSFCELVDATTKVVVPWVQLNIMSEVELVRKWSKLFSRKRIKFLFTSSMLNDVAQCEDSDSSTLNRVVPVDGSAGVAQIVDKAKVLQKWSSSGSGANLLRRPE